MADDINDVIDDDITSFEQDFDELVAQDDDNEPPVGAPDTEVEQVAEEAIATTESEKTATERIAPVTEPPAESVEVDSLDTRYSTLNGAYESLVEKIAQQYEDGEISYKGAQVKQAQLHTRYASEMAKLNAEANIVAQQQHQAEQSWAQEQAQFFDSNVQFKDPILHGALAAALTALYQDPANANKSQAQLLQDAAEQVSGKFAIATPSTTQKAAELLSARQAKLARNVSVSSKTETQKPAEPTDPEALFNYFADKDERTHRGR
jgi:hypothetical protein